MMVPSRSATKMGKLSRKCADLAVFGLALEQKSESSIVLDGLEFERRP